jgi:hypothetical protein
VHPGPDIDLYACDALFGGSARAALNELTRAHMLTEYVPRRFRFHDLLRAYATEHAENDVDREKVAGRMLDHYVVEAENADRVIQPCREGVVRTPPVGWRITTYAEAMTWFAAEHAVLMALVSFAAGGGFAAHAWRLAWAFATFLRRDGRFADRVAVSEVALSVTSMADDPVARSLLLRVLGREMNRVGRSDEALGHLREAAMLAAVVKDQSSVSRVHLAYSRVFEVDRDFERALKHALQAWAIEENGDQPLRQADVLNQMGRILAKSRRYAEALPIIQQARSLYAQVHHRDGQADALVTIGDIHRDLGDHADAAESYRDSLDLDRQLGDRYWEGRVLERLGWTYVEMCDTSRARVAFQAALDVFNDIHPARAEQIAEVLHDL